MLKKLIVPCLIAVTISACPVAVIAQVAVSAQEDAAPVRDPTGEAIRPGRARSDFRRMNTVEVLADAFLLQGDEDNDKQLTRQELLQLAERWYTALDVTRADLLGQEEFLGRFGDLIGRPQGARPPRAAGGSTPDRFLGLFVALDADKDGSISRAEFTERFGQWFEAWKGDEANQVDRVHLVAGLRVTLPRTNLGTGLGRASQERLPGLPEPPPSPVLAPADAVKTIQLAEGFHVDLAAAEPMVEDPIALSFDEDGRLYVLEMRSYMLDIDGTGERDPIGRISLLVDTDGDGRFDRSTIFVDQLVLPRAVAAVKSGLLYVADYKLYFARDSDGDGRADQIKLVDPDYGGGNIEHAPNGLMTSLDNWIYNARSQFRYRWLGNVLVKQPTENRGQWGITQDNYGRLFYNVNNSQLLGDYTPPNYMSRNPHHPTAAGLNLFVATDQRVFPVRMNTAVNRGYLPDVLDATGKVYVFASSCSPVIYRGDNFPAEFVGNAFVCDSAANLIKRNLVFDANLTLTSRFAYEGSEFLASTDERFRPVALSNGPDGALWAVDMYRGINQYGMFMTEYLRRESLERGLDKGIHFGRIYRIVSDAKAPGEFHHLSQESSSALVDRLSHPNGWIRDTAQRLLVQRADQSVVPRLLQLVSQGTDAVGRVHGLWTLEGLFLALPERLPSSGDDLAGADASQDVEAQTVRLLEVDPGLAFEALTLTDEALDACYEAMGDEHPQVQVAAIRVAESLTRWSPEDQIFFRQKLAEIIGQAAPEVLFQAALSAGNLVKPDSLPLLVDMATRNSDHLLIREAVVSGLQRWELPFLKTLLVDPRWTDELPGRSLLLQILASAVMREGHPINVDELLTLTAGQNSKTTAWRKQSLLRGMSATTTSRSSRPIRMRSAPAALEELAKSNDRETVELIEKLRSRLAWPGHQYDTLEQRPAGRPLTADEQLSVAEGKLVFRQVCAGCHGLTGEGIRPLAAPLVDSDWVLGSDERLIRVLLHGLTGPVSVDGITYQPPVVLPAMPAVGALEDAKIAAVLSYIRREWGHEADPVSEDRVAHIRRETQDRGLPWTAEELLTIPKANLTTP